MKIQLKRSNVLEGGTAKAPTAAQMEYGELAVNYNSTDPVIFIKDSSNGVIRLTNNQDVNDGQINVDAGEGLEASGSNATANQSGKPHVFSKLMIVGSLSLLPTGLVLAL